MSIYLYHECVCFCQVSPPMQNVSPVLWFGCNHMCTYVLQQISSLGKYTGSRSSALLIIQSLLFRAVSSASHVTRAEC